jgi:hypothetical protein
MPGLMILQLVISHHTGWTWTRGIWNGLPPSYRKWQTSEPNTQQ